MGPFLRANRVARYKGVENGEWKFLVFNEADGEPRMPQGAIGFRWQKEAGRWNLEPKDGLDGTHIDPRLSLVEQHDDQLLVNFTDFGDSRTFRRGVPVRYVETDKGRTPVATVFDLLMAQFGVPR